MLGSDAAKAAKPDVLLAASAPKPLLANALAELWGVSFKLLPKIGLEDISVDILEASRSELVVLADSGGAFSEASYDDVSITDWE